MAHLLIYFWTTSGGQASSGIMKVLEILNIDSGSYIVILEILE